MSLPASYAALCNVRRLDRALAAMTAEWLKDVRARFSIDLHPSKAQDVMGGIKEILNAKLLCYDDDLGGVMLCHSNERLLSKQGNIHPYFPYIHVEVDANISLFQPKPGNYLVGDVIKIGADYIGLLVLGIFNAAIRANNIRKDFVCNLQDQVWSSRKHPAHRIEVGKQVKFQVTEVLEQSGFFSIAGSLLSKRTGLFDWEGSEADKSAPVTQPASGKAAKKAKASKRLHEPLDEAGGAEVPAKKQAVLPQHQPVVNGPQKGEPTLATPGSGMPGALTAKKKNKKHKHDEPAEGKHVRGLGKQQEALDSKAPEQRQQNTGSVPHLPGVATEVPVAEEKHSKKKRKRDKASSQSKEEKGVPPEAVQGLPAVGKEKHASKSTGQNSNGACRAHEGAATATHKSEKDKLRHKKKLKKSHIGMPENR